MIEHWAQQLAPAGVNPIWVVIGIKAAIMLACFVPAISVIAMFTIWWERKVAGHIQSRVGPMHVGKFHGWAQSIADGVKLILKEDLVPASADSFMFRIAPYLAFAPVFAAFIALPFGPQFTFEAGLNIGVLYLLAVLSVEVMSTILAGWGSNSKWAVYGAMREACQMVSYEIPLGVSIITGVLVAGTLNMVALGYLQGGGMHEWFMFHNPFIFLSFTVYFVASLASNKRAPFDLPESESELVAGYLTEYSGLRWSLFFLGEYNAMFAVGAIQAALFLGAWNSPLGQADPVYNLVGYDPQAAGIAYATGATGDAPTFETKAQAMNDAYVNLKVSEAKADLAAWEAMKDKPADAKAPDVAAAEAEASAAAKLSGAGLILINVYGVFWFALKAMGTIFLQIWIRWTLPRIRIDQVLYTCVKVLLPFSLLFMVATACWLWLIPQAAAPIVGDSSLSVNWGHLVSDTPVFQTLTQWVLLGIFLAINLSFVGFVVAGWKGVLSDSKDQPPKSLFPDVMPVGTDIAYTTLPKPAAEGASEGDEASAG